MADATHIPQEVEDFITHWAKAEASERANAQPFLIGLAKILGVPEPSNSHTDGYTFEFPVKIPTGPGTTTEGFVPKLRQLFAEMQTGTDYSVILNKKLLRFNGGLFHEASVLPLDGTQLGILIKASQMQWKDVEPAIFGTLLERALNPDERHQLGAHFTPRAYVEKCFRYFARSGVFNSTAASTSVSVVKRRSGLASTN